MTVKTGSNLDEPYFFLACLAFLNFFFPCFAKFSPLRDDGCSPWLPASCSIERSSNGSPSSVCSLSSKPSPSKSMSSCNSFECALWCKTFSSCCADELSCALSVGEVSSLFIECPPDELFFFFYLFPSKPGEDDKFHLADCA